MFGWAGVYFQTLQGLTEYNISARFQLRLVPESHNYRQLSDVVLVLYTSFWS